MPTQKHSSTVNIFDLMSEKEQTLAERPPEKTLRQELLENTKYKDHDRYPEGTIKINKHTCVGVQCKICIKVCPTNALYWTNTGVGVTEDLCLHCEACVLCCMVDDCIRITRKTSEGKTECFSKPLEVLTLTNQQNTRKRGQRVSDIFPSAEAYVEKYSKTKL